MTSGATFSPCGQYRYKLWRTWDAALPPAVFIMLNPSTADEVANDPTVERCERRARAMGYGGLRVGNIFALRSTDPAALYSHADPVGPDNDKSISELVAGSGKVICAWGTHGGLMDRGAEARRLLLDLDVTPHYLKLNKDGSPGHPLYIGYDVKPQEWRTS